jgi:hypothetical protein
MLLMVSLAMVFRTVPPGTTLGSAVLHSKAAAGAALARFRARARMPPASRDRATYVPAAREGGVVDAF